MPPGRARRLTGRHPGKLVATRARCVLTEARTTATQQHCRRVLNEHPELQTCPRQHALPSFMPMTDSSTAPLPRDAHSDLRAEVADQAARLIADGGIRFSGDIARALAAGASEPGRARQDPPRNASRADDERERTSRHLDNNSSEK